MAACRLLDDVWACHNIAPSDVIAEISMRLSQLGIPFTPDWWVLYVMHSQQHLQRKQGIACTQP